MADDDGSVEPTKEETEAARIAALPLPVVSIETFILSQTGGRMGGSSLILEHSGDSASIGVAAGQEVGDDVAAKKRKISSISISVARKLNYHGSNIYTGSKSATKTETKDYTLMAGKNKTIGPVREQYKSDNIAIFGAPLGEIYVDNEDYTIVLLSVQDEAGKPLQTDKTPPPQPALGPQAWNFPWWILGVGITVAIIVVIIIWLWKSGRLTGTAHGVAPAAPAAAAPAASVTVV